MRKLLLTPMMYLRSVNVQILLWCSGVVVLWRACLEVINQTLVPMMQMAPVPANKLAGHLLVHRDRGFFENMQRWLTGDSGWYNLIMTHGYVIFHHLKAQETIAFFPLFPDMVRIVSDVLHVSVKTTSMVCNFMLVVGAAFFLYKITEHMAIQARRANPAMLARVSVILFLLNPASFFFVSMYADALLVFCITISIYFALRHSFITAAVFAGLASATKSTGSLLIPVLVLMYVQENWQEIRQIRILVRTHALKLFAIIVVSASGLLAYMGYLWHRFGDPLLFIKIEKYWNRGKVSTLHVPGYIWRTDYVPLLKLHSSLTNIRVFDLYMAAVPIVIMGLILYILIWHRKRFGWLALFSLLTLAMPLSTGQTTSLNRYVLALTPLFSLVAVYFYGSSHKTLRYIVQVWLWVSAILLVIFAASFLDGYFMG